MSDTVESKNKEWGYNIRKSTVCDSSVSVHARLLYVIIQSHLGPSCAEPWPSLWKLSDYMGCHRETVQKYLNELVRIGWVTKKKQTQSPEGKWLSTRFILNKD